MVIKDAPKVLEYLKKQGKINTFKFARELGINRHKLLDIIKKLEAKGALEFKSGIVNFLKFLPEEKKPAEPIRKVSSKPKKKVEYKTKRAPQKKARAKRKPKILEGIQAENKQLKEKLSELEVSIKRKSGIKNKKLKEQAKHIENFEKRIKELQQKVNLPPKVVRRTIVKNIIKKVPVKSKKFQEQAECIEKLEKTIKALQQKASAPPKIIRRTIIKNIIKKVPVKKEKTEAKQKFKLPKFNLHWAKHIKQLETPEFIDQKINIKKTKINFTKLNRDIQQLHIPEVLRFRI